VQCRNELVEHYAPLVHIQAARLSRKLPAQIGYDEICSAGYDGLIEAVEGYDPEKKAKFETFCQQRIIGAVMDWLRSLDPQSRTVRTFEKKRLSVREMLDAELGRPPLHSEIARRMNISQDRYDQLSRISQLGREVHFSAMDPRGNSDARGRSSERAWDVGDPDQTDPSSKMARAMLTEFVTRGLSREERLVLVLYYFEDLTMAEIGVVLDLSESRVSQIHKDVIGRLRQRFKGKLEEEMVA
jgi:RNA polymerase sigma factor for flagellar operon FliA